MNDKTEQPELTPEQEADKRAIMAELMRRMAYAQVMEKFNIACSAVVEDLKGDPEVAELIHDGKRKVADVAAQLVDNAEYIGAILIAVRHGQNSNGEEGYGLTRSVVGSQAMVQTILPLAHLVNEYEAEGVEPPSLTGVETEVQVGDDVVAQWPVCPGCGKRHKPHNVGGVH